MSLFEMISKVFVCPIYTKKIDDYEKQLKQNTATL